MRAAAAAGGEQLLAHRVVDDAVLDAAAHLAGDRYREHREAVHEVGGAVQRVDDPDGVAAAAGAALLGEEGVVGVGRADVLDDRALGGAVDLGDEVVAALGGDVQAVEPDQAADDDFARAAGGADGDVEEGVHRGT